MKKTFILSFSFILTIYLFIPISLNSQAFDYLKKSKSELNKDVSKRPSDQTLQRTAKALSNMYHSTNNADTKKLEADLNKSQTVINTSMIKQQDLMKKTNALNLSDIHYSYINGLPFFITIPKQNFSNKRPDKLLTTKNIYNYIDENKNVFQIDNPQKELKITEHIKDNEGNSHIRLQQYYEELPVWGKELIMHFDKNNNLYLVNGRYNKTLTGLYSTEYLYSKDKNINIAMNDLKKTTQIIEFDKSVRNLLNYYGPKAEKYIWFDEKTNKPYLVYVIEIRPNLIDNWRYFIDARSGIILEKYNATPRDGSVTATAKDGLGKNRTINAYLDKGIYYMVDATKSMFNNNISDPKGIILTMSNNYLDLTQDAKPNTIINE